MTCTSVISFLSRAATGAWPRRAHRLACRLRTIAREHDPPEFPVLGEESAPTRHDRNRTAVHPAASKSSLPEPRTIPRPSNREQHGLTRTPDHAALDLGLERVRVGQVHGVREPAHREQDVVGEVRFDAPDGLRAAARPEAWAHE